MSRIGNKPIAIPAGVEITLDGATVTTKGPKGTLTKTFQPIIGVEVKENFIYVTRPNEEKTTKQLHGTTRASMALIYGDVLEVRNEWEVDGMTMVSHAYYRRFID